MTIELHLEASDKILSSTLALELFRICQEAFQNIIKHAKANRLKLFVDFDKGIIVINDDGKGFNLMDYEAGYGLSNMKNRIQKLGGTCELESQVGIGTTVSLKF